MTQKCNKEIQSCESVTLFYKSIDFNDPYNLHQIPSTTFSCHHFFFSRRCHRFMLLYDHRVLHQVCFSSSTEFVIFYFGTGLRYSIPLVYFFIFWRNDWISTCSMIILRDLFESFFLRYVLHLDLFF